MHETAIVNAILTRAEAEANGEAITGLRLVVGPLAGISPQALRSAVERNALQRWGHVPTVEIEESEDLTDGAAQGVTLLAMRLGR